MSDLTSAMDINSPSLYAAFGSKEELFREAVELYTTTYGAGIWNGLFDVPTTREAVELMLEKTVEAYTRPGNPRGCLVTLSAIHCEDKSVRNFLREKRRISLESLRRRFEQGIKDGDVPRRIDVDAMTEFYGTFQQGLALRARDGARREEMLKSVRAAMAAWETCAQMVG